MMFLTSNIFAQEVKPGVGINTENNRGTLDLNGNLRVEVLENKTGDNSYQKLLSTNETNQINVIDFSAVKKVNRDETTSKLIYNAVDVDNTKEISCSNLTFKLDGANPKVYMKLNNWYPSNPISTINIQYGVKHWGNVEGQSNGYIYKNLTKTFTNTNFSKFQVIDERILNTGSIFIFHIVLPGQGDLYRVTASRLKNTEKQSNYSVVCEYFYKTDI